MCTQRKGSYRLHVAGSLIYALRELEPVTHKSPRASLRPQSSSETRSEVRKFVQSYVKPGMKMVDMCQALERKTHELIEVSAAS